MSVVAVFVVRDVLTPGCRDSVVVHVEEREMAHEAVWRGAVPVLFARLEEDPVTRLEDLDGAAAPLSAADPLEDVDRLPVRVGMPGGARAGREVHPGRLRARRGRRRGNRVEVHGACEPLARPATGLERVARYLHQLTAF